MASSLENAISRIPQFINVEDTNSRTYQIIKAFIDELDVNQGCIDQIDAMIGIDTTYDTDLYDRWGRLLNIRKGTNETNSAYRNRLKLSISILSGGTADALQYVAGVAMGINDNQTEMDLRIHIYDTWAYPGTLDPDISTGYGNFVVQIDFAGLIYESAITIINNIEAAIAYTKAAGTFAWYIYNNVLYGIVSYDNFGDFVYSDLNTITYLSIG